MDRKPGNVKKVYPLFMEMHHSRFISMYPTVESPTKTILKEPQPLPSYSKTNLSQVEIIKKLMEVYQLLCEISQLINQHFQLQILCFSFNTFLSIVFNVYYILIFRNIIATANASGNAEAQGRASAMESLICFMAISIIGCMMDILCIVCACEHTVNAVRKTF